MTRIVACRSCGSSNLDVVLDLGLQPIANALVEPARLGEPEEKFPLQIAFCHGCALVQVTESIPPEVLFSQDYPYFSSYLPALVAHSREHALAAKERLRLGPDSFVVEVASNDGYLLKNFVEAGVPALGIDPAAGPAKAAREQGVDTLNDFFNVALAERLAADGKRADLMLANNVLAHVDDINGFVAGFAVLLKDEGVAEFEFPYVRDLIDSCAFDTIYHEHVFYHALTALEPLFARYSLHFNDVLPIEIHGGSLRLTVSKRAGKSDRLQALQAEEAELGMGTIAYYSAFADRVVGVRENLLALVADLKAQGKRIAAYGAAAKGATLLNYAGLGGDALDYVVDRNTFKVGKYMPGLKLLIRRVETIIEDRPDYLLLLAWNFGAEIMSQQSAYAMAGGRFIVPIPQPRIVDPATVKAA